MDTKLSRVLLVEDETMIQNLYSSKFQKAGFGFLVLPNADGDFLKKVTEFNPDIILMDLHFEGSQSNGASAAEVLQFDERTKNIPIIFLTNADIEELAERAKKITSSIGFLVKAQYLPNEILSKVQDLYTEFLKHKKI